MSKNKTKIPCLNEKQKDYAHVASILDIRRVSKEGDYFIRTRVTLGKEQKYFATGSKLSIEDWLRIPKAKDARLVEIRKSIEASNNVIFKAVKQLCELNSFSFDRLNNLLGRGYGNSINSLFQQKIDDLTANNQLSTAEYYKGALNGFICYKCGKQCARKEMQQCKKKGIEISFNDINADYLQKYETYAISVGYSKTTVAMRMRALRAVCNIALTNGIIRPNDYCFKKGTANSYTIRKTASRKIAYSLPEIKMLADFTFKEIEKYKKMSRDLFLFSFWANGLNFADLIRLKWSDYSFKNKEFTFIREKTKRTATEEIFITFPLFESIQEIITKWGNDSVGNNGYVFPFLNGDETLADEIRITKNLTSTVNHNLKTIVKNINEKLPIEERLFEGITTYTARHSFATILAHNRVPESYIGFSLGHSRKTVTDSYIDGYSVEDRRNYNKLLQFQTTKR